MWEISGSVAWVISAAIFLWLLWDFFAVNAKYSEETLLSAQPSDVSPNGVVGRTVVLSADGNTAFVSAPGGAGEWVHPEATA